MFRFAAFFLLALVTAAKAEAPDRFAGRYLGCAVSGGEWAPIETVFAVSGDSLSGSYVFLESTGRSVTGTIRPDGPWTGSSAAVRWSDVYGEGPAAYTFAADASRFDGYWTTDAGTERFTWFGVRAGSGGTAPDCRIPVS